MRICIYGAGASGGFCAVRLANAGHEVSIIARGEALRAIRRQGLHLTTAGQVETCAVHPPGHPLAPACQQADAEIVQQADFRALNHPQRDILEARASDPPPKSALNERIVSDSDFSIAKLSSQQSTTIRCFFSSRSSQLTPSIISALFFHKK